MPSIFETINKLNSFKSLEEGWNYGEGNPLSSRIVAWAKGILDVAYGLGFSSADAFPGVNGEVQVNLYHGRYYFEFIVENSDSVMFVLEKDKKVVRVLEDLSLRQALSELERAYQECDLSDTSTLNNTLIKHTGVLPQWPFRYQATAILQESPLYAVNVFEWQNELPANTSLYITEQWKILQDSILSSIRESCRMVPNIIK